MDVPQPPPPHGVLLEGLWVLELPRLLLRAPELAAQPRGSGETVLVLPGYGATDASTALLRAYLRYLGYRARGWGLGRNRGDVPALLPRVAALVRETARATGAPLRLVGWSLGGYLAREAAREHPEAVERVVTLGSPVAGGPKYTAMARLFRPLGVDLDAIEAAVAARESVPLRVPVTAIYSKADGIVGWRACVDARNRDVEHVEVRTTHLGLGFAPEVYRVVARRLAGRSEP
jgi:pimeloyl-ACP methyl ester carboxylesterase